jgi:hypothetical protein
MRRGRQPQHVEPAIDQRPRPARDDGPGRAGGCEVVEELTCAGDFFGVGAEALGDEGFDFTDVYRVKER